MPHYLMKDVVGLKSDAVGLIYFFLKYKPYNFVRKSIENSEMLLFFN
jgi:hypothetical protein